MKYLFCSCFLLIANASVAISQSFLIQLDTVNFEYPWEPFIVVHDNGFNEISTNDHLGSDKSISYPMKADGQHFKYKLEIKKPVLIQLVNGTILAIPGQEIKGTVSGLGSYIDLKDPNNINFFFIELQKKIAAIRVQSNKNTAPKEFLVLYDSMRSIIHEQLSMISLPKNREFYKVDMWAISYIRTYCMAELGNFLFSPTWLKKDFDMTVYRKHSNDIVIPNPNILLEFWGGRLFLQRHFFHNALPSNNYDLVRTFNTDSLFKNKEIRKYLGYRYFAHLCSDRSVLSKINDFDSAFALFKRSYTFSVDEKEALHKLGFRIKENRSSILSAITKEDILNTVGGKIGLDEKSKVFSEARLLYFWASWCAPCRQYMATLRSNRFSYNGKPYSMIFISIDTDINKWKKVKYPFLDASNSFKIQNPLKSRLLQTYDLKAVPRVLLVQNGILMDQNLDKNQLLQDQ